MFFNGFTLLLMIISGATAYQVGNYFGYSRGRVSLLREQIEHEQRKKQFFAEVSRSK